jgi:serine/threonine protein kinase
LPQSRRASHLNPNLRVGDGGGGSGNTATTPPKNAPSASKAASAGKRPRIDLGSASAPDHAVSKQRRLCKRSHQSQQQASAKGYGLPRTDDADGHLVYCLGDGLCPTELCPHGRYKILSDLGEGTFGKVVECWDRHEATRVAIKIVRSVSKYRDAARLEIEVLEHLEANDPEGKYHCVRLLGWFDYQAHVCIAFEKLGPSLYERLRRNRFRPFSLGRVREIGFQLLESVHFVHSLTLIHTDLKPENILLADSDAAAAVTGASAPVASAGTSAARAKLEEASFAAAANRDDDAVKEAVVGVGGGIAAASDTTTPLSSRDSRGARNSVTTCATPPHTPPPAHASPPAKPRATIKLIDFGSATFDAQHHSSVISTRHYRAPEVILGLGWTYPCDLWSIGCILVELYTGQALFQTHENLEHLAMMNTILGPIPDSMICRADQYSQKYFTPAPKLSSFLRPAPSDRPPSGHPRRRAMAYERGDGDEAGRRLHRAFRRAGQNTEAGALSTASASGSAVALVAEDHQVVDQSASVPPTRALNWPAGASSVASVKAVRRVKSLARMVTGTDDHANFLDLLHGLLAFEPDRRCTAADALRHPFFAGCDPSDLLNAPTISSGGESSACASQATGSGNAFARAKVLLEEEVRRTGKGRVRSNFRTRGGALLTEPHRASLNLPSGAAQRHGEGGTGNDFHKLGPSRDVAALPFGNADPVVPPMDHSSSSGAQGAVSDGMTANGVPFVESVAPDFAPAFFAGRQGLDCCSGFATGTAYVPPTAHAFVPVAFGADMFGLNLLPTDQGNAPAGARSSRLNAHTEQPDEITLVRLAKESTLQVSGPLDETELCNSVSRERPAVQPTSGALSDVTIVHGGQGVDGVPSADGADSQTAFPGVGLGHGLRFLFPPQS